MFENNISISDRLVKEKARCLLDNINDSLPAEKKVHIKFSNGWTEKFKQRKDFKMYRLHSENGDTSGTAMQLELSRLRLRLLNYQANDFFQRR